MDCNLPVKLNAAIALLVHAYSSTNGSQVHYLSVKSIPDTEFAIAKRAEGSRSDILRFTKDGPITVGTFPSSSGALQGVYQFVRVGQHTLLVADSQVFVGELGNGVCHFVSKGYIETLPMRVHGQYWGIYNSNDHRERIFCLSSSGFQSADKPGSLLSFALIGGRIFYRLNNAAVVSSYRLGVSVPTIRNNRFKFGTTKITSIPRKWVVNVALGSMNLYVCREVAEKVCRVWVCKFRRNVFERVNLIADKFDFSDATYDQAMVLGKFALLTIYDGNLTRSVYYYDIERKITVPVGVDVQPATPTVANSRVFGVLHEFEIREEGHVYPERYVLYELTDVGLKKGYLPSDTSGVVDLPGGRIARLGVDGILRLGYRFPKLVSSHWVF